MGESADFYERRRTYESEHWRDIQKWDEDRRKRSEELCTHGYVVNSAEDVPIGHCYMIVTDGTSFLYAVVAIDGKKCFITPDHFANGKIWWCRVAKCNISTTDCIRSIVVITDDDWCLERYGIKSKPDFFRVIINEMFYEDVKSND